MGQISELVPATILRDLQTQAAVLAYRDVFIYCAIAAFCVIPFTFIFSPTKSGGGGGGGH
jgi:DHA2 family multidrug resistance protein